LISALRACGAVHSTSDVASSTGETALAAGVSFRCSEITAKTSITRGRACTRLGRAEGAIHTVLEPVIVSELARLTGFALAQTRLTLVRPGFAGRALNAARLTGVCAARAREAFGTARDVVVRTTITILTNSYRKRKKERKKKKKRERKKDEKKRISKIGYHE
jgi:hypothetical protein